MQVTPFLRSPLGSVLRYAVTLGLLAWLAGRVDWSRFGRLGVIEWPQLLGAALLAGVAYPLQAWRWQLLLRAQGITLPAGWVHRVFWIGQFWNSFLPGGVAGDALRFGYLWRARPDRRGAAAAGLVADRLLGLGALLALAVLALGLHLSLAEGGSQLHQLFAASLAALGLLLVVGWSAIRTRWWEPLSVRLLGPERATALHDAALALGAQPGVLVKGAGLSVVVWLVDFISLWLLAGSVGLTVGVLAMTVAAAAAYVAAALPISIGGHGVREGALVVVLTLLGLGAGHSGALAHLALVFWAVTVAWSAVGGLVWLLAPPRDTAA